MKIPLGKCDCDSRFTKHRVDMKTDITFDLLPARIGCDCHPEEEVKNEGVFTEIRQHCHRWRGGMDKTVVAGRPDKKLPDLVRG